MDETEMVDRVRSRLNKLCPGHGMRVSYDVESDTVRIFVPEDGKKREFTIIGVFKAGDGVVIDSRLWAACKEWTKLQE